MATSLGSNEWALGLSRTADGTTMLLVNPHQSFFGVERYVEIHFHSDEGLVFSGLTRFGFLLPYMGNNARLGWTYRDNYADISDLYVERQASNAIGAGLSRLGRAGPPPASALPGPR